MLNSQLTKLIKQSSSEFSFNWLLAYRQRFEDNFTKRELFLAFSLSSRHFKKQSIVFESEQEHQLESLDIKKWSLTHLARIWLILNIPDNNPELWFSILNELFDSADINEQICLYKSLSLFPYQSSLVKKAGEGLRSNAKLIFEAIALDNPYCQQHFDEYRWNQMVLKALFIESNVFSIIGIRKNRNLSLANMCFDYIRERSKAGRDLSAEIWFLVAPYITGKELTLLRDGLEKPDKWISLAVVIAMQESLVDFQSLDMVLYEKSQSILNAGAWEKNEGDSWTRFITLYNG